MSFSQPIFDGLVVKMEILHPDFINELFLMQRISENSNLTMMNSPMNFCSGSSKPTSDSEETKKKFSELEKEASKRKSLESTSTLNKKNGSEFSELAEKQKRKLKYIFEEMVHFEHRFLETLRMLTEISDEINARSSFRENTSLREIFKDIPSLYHLHGHICQSLDKLNPEISGNVVPSAFVDDKEIPFLNIYKSFMCRYVSNYPSLVNYQKDKEFATLCREIIQKSKYEEQRIQDVCGMYFGVHSSLTRFRLLFSKLEETLSPRDQNIQSVKKALKVLGDLLQLSEGEVLRQDRISDAQVAFSKIDGCELNYRHIPPLLREGPCKKIPRRSSHKRSLDRHLFLFTSCLIITEAANSAGRYQVKSELLLNGMSLSQVSADDDINTPHCFRIKAKELCVELAFVNEKEKSEWWEAIQNAIQNECNRKGSIQPQANSEVEGSGTSAAEWVKDEQSTMCAECHAEFTVLNRRHHCRACGKLFCGTCSDYRAPIAFLGGKKKRVCVVDYYLINKDEKPPTTAIMEAILRRAQEQSAPTEAGYMYWCVYQQGSWHARPAIKNTKSSAQHKYVTPNLSESYNWQMPTTTSFPQSVNEGNPQRQSSDSAIVGERVGHEELLPGPRRKSNPPFPQRSIAKEITDSSEALATAQNVRSPVQHSNLTICLSRMYCVLQTDTLIAMYAARADTKAKGQLPLIGTRLFYLDQVSSINAHRQQRISLVTEPTSSNHEQLVHSSLSNSPSQTSLASTDNRTSTPSSSNIPSDSSDDEHLVKPSEIRAGNPLYRNHKPPAVPLKPKHIGEAVRKLQEMAEGHVVRMAELFEASVRVKQDRHSPVTRSNSTPKDMTGFNEAKTIQQLNSISPIVLSVLQNNLGFLILPMNTDCLAHYFEAPSYEARTRWINSIRRACLAYLKG